MPTEPVGKKPPEQIQPTPELPQTGMKDKEGPLNKTFLGMKMTETQFKQAWATLINDVSRAIQHEMQRAKDAIKELGKSFEEEN